MKCVICKQGETYSGMATVTLERAATTLIFKEVPALVRKTCGEEYVGEDVTRMLLVHAEEAIKAGVVSDDRPSQCWQCRRASFPAGCANLFGHPLDAATVANLR